MLLAIDCGNTHIVLGVFLGDKLVKSWRVSTNSQRTEDEYLVLLTQFLAGERICLKDIKAIIVGSVVPAVNTVLTKMAEQHLSAAKLLFVDHTTRTGIRLLVDNPEEVGADRIVDALAAHSKYPGDLIIVDFGTATTLDCVSGQGEYLGGAICPGVEISRNALFAHAAKLSSVVLSRPPQVIGTNTADFLRSGLLWGYGGQVDSLITRMSAEWGSIPHVVATGGLAPLISEYSDKIDTVDIDLTLEGLRLIWDKLN
jgi:type III pantothenate kinase